MNLVLAEGRGAGGQVRLKDNSVRAVFAPRRPAKQAAGGEFKGHGRPGLGALLALLAGLGLARAEVNVYLTDVPDYDWYGACFGTATGNLIGFWDRHGLPNMYTGPTAGGVAPLDSYGANSGIRSLWMSKAGRDGLPANQFGHEDDYYVEYDRAYDDPYKVAGRTEHTPDCIGDFIGVNQKKWTDMNGECDGNIDGFSFVYWDKTGARRINYTPTEAAGMPAVDIQSGLRAFAQHRGYEADTVTQLVDFNTEVTVSGQGFKFADLRAEIDAGYPVLIFLQNWQQMSRRVGNMPNANPEIHGMLAVGYYVPDSGIEYVHVRTSWATGNAMYRWRDPSWVPWAPVDMPVRGLIAFHPKPRILSFEPKDNQITIRWEGPDADVYDKVEGTLRKGQWYVLERASSLSPGDFTAVAEPTTARELTISESPQAAAYYRLKVVPPPN